MDVSKEITEVKAKIAAVEAKLANPAQRSAAERDEVLNDRLNKLYGQLEQLYARLPLPSSAAGAGSAADALAIERERTKQKEFEAKIELEKVRRDIALASIKRKAAARGASTRDTSTIHTPAMVEAPQSQSSTTVLVEGQPVFALSEEAKVAVKKYAGYFGSVVSASGWAINFHPSPHPTVVKLLGRDGVAVQICAYTPQELKNAYCALIEECGSDPSVYLSKHTNNELVRDYYSEGYTTPNPLFR